MLVKLSRVLPVDKKLEELLKQIERIGSVHSSRDLMAYILKQFKEDQLPIERLKIFIDILIGMLSEKHPHHFFYFTSTSRIELKAIPDLSSGFVCTGELNLEQSNLMQSQRLFTLMSSKGKSRTIEVTIENAELRYYITKGGHVKSYVKSGIKLKENLWHFFMIAHIEKQLTIIVNGALMRQEVVGVKGLDCGVIGNTKDLVLSKKPFTGAFNGEIARINFYKPTNVVRERVRRMYLGESGWDTAFTDRQSAVLTVDPNSCRLSSRTDSLVASFDTLGDNVERHVQNVRVFYNRPAKDMLASLGGFKTCFLLMTNRIFYKRSEPQCAYFCCGRSRIEICIGLVKLLHVHCINDNSVIFQYFLQSSLPEILVRIFELVAKTSQFTKEFAESVFYILDLNLENRQRSAFVLTLINRFLLNPSIWSTSPVPVQVSSSSL